MHALGHRLEVSMMLWNRKTNERVEGTHKAHGPSQESPGTSVFVLGKAYDCYNWERTREEMLRPCSGSLPLRLGPYFQHGLIAKVCFKCHGIPAGLGQDSDFPFHSQHCAKSEELSFPSI